MKLYVKFKRPRTVKEFLIEFFKPTYDSFLYQSSATYYDKKCTIIQCEAYKHRSFNDLFTLVKTYYPSYTEKKLMYNLVNLKINNSVLYYLNCNDIKDYTLCFYNKNILSIAGLYFKFDNNNKNWKYLFSLVNLHSIGEIHKHLRSL